MMDIWVVTDRYDDGDQYQNHLHITEKGAYVKAYEILHEVYDNIAEEQGLCPMVRDGEVPEIEQELMSASQLLYDMVMSVKGWDDYKLTDLRHYLTKFSCVVGEGCGWTTEITVHKHRLKP